MSVMVRELLEAEYPLWDELLRHSPQRCIFAQRWWIDTVTRGEAILLGCFEDEQLRAGLPIWPCMTLGVRRLRQPPLTPYWGPLLPPLSGKYATRLSAEIELLRAFAQALRAWPDVTLTLHPSLHNWLPFYWQGFQQTTRYTHRIEQLADNTPSGSGLHRSIRNALNRAKSHGLQLVENVEPEIIATMSRLSMARQALRSSAEIRAFWPALVHAAAERDCVYNCAARDAGGQVHAGYAMLWDDRYAYDLYGGGDPQFRETGGGTLVVQHLLEVAATRVPGFDFEGSMNESIGRFFRQFGGELTPYLALTRTTSKRLTVARAVQGWRVKAGKAGSCQRTSQASG